jgi:hypothetical protein
MYRKDNSVLVPGRSVFVTSLYDRHSRTVFLGALPSVGARKVCWLQPPHRHSIKLARIEERSCEMSVHHIQGGFVWILKSEVT